MRENPPPLTSGRRCGRRCRRCGEHWSPARRSKRCGECTSFLDPPEVRARSRSRARIDRKTRP